MEKSKNEKISDSMKGNKNALVWDYDKCQDTVDKLKSMVNELEEYVIQGRTVKGYKYDFIGELTLELGLDRKVLKREIKDHAPELSSEVDLMYSYMERNCYANTKKGIIREATGIVNLKSNHKWKDRVDNTSGDEPIQPISLDPETAKAISKKVDENM